MNNPAMSNGGLGIDHPAIRTLNGIIASKSVDYRAAQCRLEKAFEVVAKSGQHRVNTTSYENPQGICDNYWDAPTWELEEIARLAAEMISLDNQIGELVRAKLSCFRDVDFHGGDYWVPTLLSGRMLDDEVDHDEEGLAAILATNPLPVTVTLSGSDFLAEAGDLSTDALGLLDTMQVLVGPPHGDEPAGIPVNSVPAILESALVPPGILAISGSKRRRIVAGPHASAFRHALRVALRKAAGYRGDDEG